MEKVSFEELLDSMSHFLNFPDVENEMDMLIADRKAVVRQAAPRNGRRHGIDVIDDFLKEDKADRRNLKMLIALSGGSLEKFRRIVAFLFDRADIKRIRNDTEMRRKITEFLNDPDTADSVPRFIRRGFALPANWTDLLKDGPYMNAKIRDDLVSTYSVRIGFKLEKEIAKVVEELGCTCKKGSVFAVDNKEVDLAVPNQKEPRMLIMSSYSLTTSSSQTQRANEQTAMYNHLNSWNRSRSRSRSSDCLFVNVIDGGGWISRKNDLRHIWRNCDHCFTYKTLDNLQKLLKITMGV